MTNVPSCGVRAQDPEAPAEACERQAAAGTAAETAVAGTATRQAWRTPAAKAAGATTFTFASSPRTMELGGVVSSVELDAAEEAGRAGPREDWSPVQSQHSPRSPLRMPKAATQSQVRGLSTTRNPRLT
jgi:hypothetical protein